MQAKAAVFQGEGAFVPEGERLGLDDAEGDVPEVVARALLRRWVVLVVAEVKAGWIEGVDGGRAGPARRR